MEKVTVQENLALVLTDKTSNRKTGDMVQTWILNSNINPVTACKTGQDKNICGDCPHRGKSCYVNVGQAPNAIYKAMNRGSYDGKTIDTTGKLVRCGAYGDPAFISLDIWRKILAPAKDNTGYTHQWRNCSPKYSDFLMASCDSIQDYRDAKERGYRTFRVRKYADDPLLENEINCPADTMPDKVTCATCLKCNGNGGTSKKDISIPVHGVRKNNFK